MTTLTEFRQKYPQYNDMGDHDLAAAMHQRFYPDMPREEFDSKIGLQPRGMVGRAVDTVGRVVGKAAEAIQGRQDPAFASVPAYMGDTYETMQGQAQAKSVAIDDAAYGDILRKQLGNRFIRQEKDANGYPVIVYRGQDGSEQKGYVNKPGLDFQDVDRGLSATLPYLATAGPIGKLTRGVGTVGKLVTQGLGAAGTSIGQDIAAQQMGSEQDVDLGRAGMTGALGGFAAVARPLLAGGVTGGVIGASTEGDIEDKVVGGLFGGAVGASVGKGIERVQKPRVAPGAVDEQGKLSGQMRQKAERAGLNPDEMSPEDVNQWLDGVTLTADQAELAAAIETGKFNLMTTKGIRTKDPQLLSIEKDARYGNLGESAKQLLKAYDDESAKQIQGSALRRRAAEDGRPVDPYKDGVGAMVAPTRNDMVPQQVTPDQFGTSINRGLTAAKDAGDELINKAWKDVTDIVPAEQAMPLMAGKLRSRVGDMVLDSELTPAAVRMERELAAFVGGEAKSGSPGLIGETQIQTVDQMRRRLLKMKDASSSNSDRAASKAIYDGFNDWIDEIADQGFIKGNNPEAAAALRTARQVTAEVKQAFAPRDPAGKASPAGKIMQGIVDGADTPEGIINQLLGASGPVTAPKPGSVQAVRQIKKVLFDGVRGSKLVDDQVANTTFNDIRMAYWSRLVINKEGKMHTPQMIVNNVEAALRNQGSLVREMFKPDEVKIFREYVAAMKRLAYKDPNPSGTATALRAAMRNEDSWLKTFFQTQSKRELFSKHNVLMSRFYQFLAKKVPVNAFGSRDMVGTRAAERAIDPNLTLRQQSNPAGFAASATAQSDAQRQQ
jgi:hypothetical protein